MVVVVVAVVVLLCSAVAATPLSYYYSSLLSSYSHIVLWSGGRKASRGVLVTFVVSCSFRIGRRRERLKRRSTINFRVVVLAARRAVLGSRHRELD